MEAIVLNDFKPETSLYDELTLKRGEKLIIIPIDDDWCRAKKRGISGLYENEGFAPLCYLEFTKPAWFIPEVTQDEIRSILLEKNNQDEYIHADGTFIIRNSSKSFGDYSMSVKHESKIQNYSIYFDNFKFRIWNEAFDSFDKMIEYHKTHSISKLKEIYLNSM